MCLFSGGGGGPTGLAQSIGVPLSLCVPNFVARAMYQGFNKDNGAIIGLVGGQEAVDLADTQDAVGAEESMIGVDEQGYEVAMTASIDPSTGDIIWTPSYDVDKTKCRTVAMSQMTSMLRDKDRNRIYEQAIQRCFESFRSQTGAHPIVMDIGCGTGLLSLLGAKHGSRFTYSIEMFDMMAQIATETIGNLTSPDHVMVVNAKSTDIEELPIKVDILISELLDSSLLGESCIPSHVDAIRRFVKSPDECGIPIEDRVIPNRAQVFATAIQSEEVASMVNVRGLVQGREPFDVMRNDYAKDCQGGWPTMPVHWDALEHRGARKLSTPSPCLHINFFQDIYADAFTVVYEDGEPIQFKTFDSDILIESDGTVHGILLWWKTYLLSTNLDPQGSIFYSTEPGAQNWQDHWQQSLFPLPEPIVCKMGDVLRLHVSHDELSIWLTAEKVLDVSRSTGSKRKNDEQIGVNLNAVLPRPIVDERFVRKSCTCGWHLLCGADRMMRMNNKSLATLWDQVVCSVLDNLMSGNTKSKLLVDLSDGSVLALTAAMKAKKRGFNHQQLQIVSRERKVFSALFYNQLVERNNVEDVMMVWNGKSLLSILDFFSEGDEYAHLSEAQNLEIASIVVQQQLRIGALISDCVYYQTNAYPTWQAISFHYERTMLAPYLDPAATIVPRAAQVMMMPLELPELSQCYGKVHSVCGIDHSFLDARQQDWDRNLYPYRLSNYRKRSLAAPICVATLQYTDMVQSFPQQVFEIVFETAGTCDAVAIWVDYDLDGTSQHQLRYWNGVDFPSFMIQSVRFFEDFREVQPGNKLLVSSSFTVGQSDFEFGFQYA